MSEWGAPGTPAGSLPSRPLVPALVSSWALTTVSKEVLTGQVWAGGCRRLQGASPEGAFQPLSKDLAGSLCFLHVQQGAAENQQRISRLWHLAQELGVSWTSLKKL